MGSYDRGTPSAQAEDRDKMNWLPRVGAQLSEVMDVAARNSHMPHPLQYGFMTANGYWRPTVNESPTASQNMGYIHHAAGRTPSSSPIRRRARD